MTAEKPVSYWDYIRVEDLLGLQGGVEGDAGLLSNDEVMFITVHQVFELWFQLVHRELAAARDLFKGDAVAEQELSGAVRSLSRITTILRRAVDHFQVMETLTTREYLAFRDKLFPASGFQSAQLRQIEILLGLDEEDRISLGPDKDYKRMLRNPDGSASPALERVESALVDRPTFKEALESWLYRTPIDGHVPGDPGADAALDAFVGRYLDAHEAQVDGARARAVALTPADDAGRARLVESYDREKDAVRAFLMPTGDGAERLRRVRVAMIFIVTYRELPLLAWPREVLDRLVELEQVFVIFRQRHARMVERVIGRRTGTGGSSGVDYLDETALRYRIYRDLWAVRTLMIPRSAAPELENAGFYGFVSGE